MLFLPTDGSLGLNDLFTVLSAVHDVRAKWYNIGLGLQVSTGTLDAINLECQDTQNCLRRVLTEWLKSSGACWEDLVKVLKTPVIGEERLANRLEMQFCRQPTTESPPPPVHTPVPTGIVYVIE